MDMDSILGAIQWPAMAITLVAAWLVGSQSKKKRGIGFWAFIASNVLWVIWGWHDGAHALIALQVGLFLLNLRGAKKNDPDEGSSDAVVGSGSAAPAADRGGVARGSQRALW